MRCAIFITLLLLGGAARAQVLTQTPAPAPRLVLSTNPFSMGLGFYDLTLQAVAGPQLVLRADLTFYDFATTGVVPYDVVGFEANATGQYFPGQALHGFYLEGGFMTRNVATGGYEGSYDSRSYGPEVLVGVQGTWDSGLSVAIAAGAGYNLGDPDPDADWFVDEDHLILNGYIRIGLAF